MKEADEYETDLLVEIMNFRKNTKSRSREKNKKTKLLLKTCLNFLRVENEFLALLKAKNF